MSGRVQSIDALRGITIFAMIFCAAISYGAGLPAWMFHCQCPPPDYAFHPEVKGITWVDMVFPFFIFAMGAAMPFSLGRKLDKTESLLKVCLGIVKRFAILVGFGLAIGHADALGQSSLGETARGVVRFAIWLGMFAALVRTKRNWINIAGWVALVAGFLALHFFCGLPLSLEQNDIIIILLANVALMGGFVWVFTRKSILIRIGVWLLVIVMQLFGWDFAQYLVIALPATMVGDILRKPVTKTPAKFGLSAIPAALAVLVQLWGLYTRQVVADGCITLALGVAFVLLTFKDRCQAAQTGWMGFFMLVAGVVFDPIVGGIEKDYCNMSYLLVTGGQAALVLYCLMWTESRRPLSRNITMLGRNPMIAYNIAWFVICPFLGLIGLMDPIYELCETSQLLGVCQGLFTTLLMVACTNLFTKYDLYLKS